MQEAYLGFVTNRMNRCELIRTGQSRPMRPAVEPAVMGIRRPLAGKGLRGTWFVRLLREHL